MLEFMKDTSTVRHKPEYRTNEGFDVPVKLSDFTSDTSRVNRKGLRELIKDRLLNGWGIGRFKPHSVIRRGDLPTGTTVAEVFSSATSTAYKAIREIKEEIPLHEINARKRTERGDCLHKWAESDKRERVSQTTIRIFYKRYEKNIRSFESDR